MFMMMSGMFWCLMLPLFRFVDGQEVTCNVGDATPLRIVVEECENFDDYYYNFEWEVRQLGVGLITDGTFDRCYPKVFENDELCLDPSGCYFVRLSSEYGNGVPGGGDYTVFYDGTIIFSGGEFISPIVPSSAVPPVQSINFGNGCPSSAHSPAPSSSPTATPSYYPTIASPSIPTTPTMSRSNTPTAKPTIYRNRKLMNDRRAFTQRVEVEEFGLSDTISGKQRRVQDIFPYWVMEAGTNECGDGYQRLTTATKCEAFVAKCGCYTYGGTGNYNNVPKGCSLYSNLVYFNTNSLGFINENANPICESLTSLWSSTPMSLSPMAKPTMSPAATPSMSLPATTTPAQLPTVTQPTSIKTTPTQLPTVTQSMSITTITILVSAAIVSVCLGIFFFYQRRYIIGFIRSRTWCKNNFQLCTGAEDSLEDGLSNSALNRVSEQGVSNEQQPVTDQRIIDSEQVDVFLTHNWGQDVKGRDNHERVRLINTALKNEGITTWFDEEKMHGDITAKMTNGIDNAKIVIAFITGQYITKVGGMGRNGENDNCKVEFDYALRRKKPGKMLTVVMEEECLDTNQWSGAVGAFFGGRLFQKFCDNSMLNSCINDLKQNIERIKDEEDIDVAQA